MSRSSAREAGGVGVGDIEGKARTASAKGEIAAMSKPSWLSVAPCLGGRQRRRGRRGRSEGESAQLLCCSWRGESGAQPLSFS